MNKRICHISTVHDAFDDRIYYKELSTLSNFYQSFIIANTNQKCQTNNHIKIIKIRHYRHRFLRFIFGSISIFIKTIKIRPKIIHFHDPELIPLCLIFKILGFKIIYDIHEFYEQQILEKKWGNQYILSFFSYAYNVFEKLSIKLFDGCIIVTEPMYELYAKKYPPKLKKFHLVQNMPNFNFSIIQNNNLKNTSKKITLIYIGTINANRGIKEILEAIATIDDIEFLLIGEFEDKIYQQTCEQLPGFAKTKYIGKVPYQDIPFYLSKADIGLCILAPTFNHMHSLPVKIFEYFYFELPVIASNFPYWMNKFNKACLFVPFNNITNIKNSIIQLKENSEKRQILGSEGKKYLKDKYNWELEKQKLLKLYKSLIP